MTKKTLEEKTIDQITRKLGHFLADTFILYVKTLNYHWNMIGAEFFMYHKLLEQQYTSLASAIDEIAERIRMLGRFAPATLQEFLELSTLKEGRRGLSQMHMIQELVAEHEALIEKCHELVRFTDETKDQGTSDLLIEQIRFHSKHAWLLRSHLA